MSTTKPLTLPPGVNAQEFQTYLDEARSIVGGDHVRVIVGDHQFEKDNYMDPAKEHDMFYVFDKDYFIASAVVSPANVEQVQALMRLSNKTKVAVWPISIGRNIGYGGAGPRVPGSVVIDMGRMNRVLEVNETDAYCLLEPGVTYQALYDHLVEKGLNDKLWMDVPDLGGGSILANTMERGVGYTPYGDHFMMHCGLEVVLPNGELIRTGMGAVPQPGAAQPGVPPGQQQHNRCWQLFNYGFGPYHDGIFSQSNFGIVTKMGLWMMPNPGGYKAYLICFEKESDVHAMIEVIRRLRVSQIMQNPAVVRNTLLDAAIMADKEHCFPGIGNRALTDDEIQSLADRLGIGRWTLYGALYGPDVVIDAQWQVIQDAFSKIPGTKFHVYGKDKKNPGSLAIREKTMRGIPSFDELQWVDWVPNGAHFFFSPISETRGDDACVQYEISRRHIDAAGFDYIGGFIVGMREMHHIDCVLWDRTNKEDREKGLRVIRNLIDEFAAHGWGEYRTHPVLMDQIAETYGFNDHSLWKFSEQIKDAIDPNGILAPGKNGVWPSTYDKKQWRLDANSSAARDSLPNTTRPGPKL